MCGLVGVQPSFWPFYDSPFRSTFGCDPFLGSHSPQYVRARWPIDGPQVWEPRSTEQRIQTARDFQRSCQLSWPMAVDGIEDDFLRHFAPWPFRFFVFRGSKLQLKSSPVDGTHHCDEVEQAIRKFEAEVW